MVSIRNHQINLLLITLISLFTIIGTSCVRAQKHQGESDWDAIVKLARKPKKAYKKMTPEEKQKRLAQLDDMQRYVTQEAGTERAFTGKYWNSFDPGYYKCVVCGAKLFDSKSKFASGCGWPSFSDLASEKAIAFYEDNSLGMQRIEVRCANCDAHLGHVFNDGPQPTGLRYCINSASIEHVADEGK